MGGKTHTPRGEGEDFRSRRGHEVAQLASRQHGIVARGQLLAAGLTPRGIERRLEAGGLHRLHRGVYAVGYPKLSLRGRWMAAVLACGEGAVLSHMAAAALWGLSGPRAGPVDVTSSHGRNGRVGIRLHRSRLHEERASHDGIPATAVPRTLLDLAGLVEERKLERLFEEADRLGLLRFDALARTCERGVGRRGVGACRRLLDAARAPSEGRSPLEQRFAAFCRERGLPPPVHNAQVLDREVDACWPGGRLVVELDGFAYHGHRAAFERDRSRDSAMQAAGYRVVRLTHRRLEQEPDAVAALLRGLLSDSREAEPRS